MMDEVFIIAEAGVNHNGSVARAKEMVEVAAQAGADAVKFQLYDAEQLTTYRAEQAQYQKKEAGDMDSQRKMLKQYQLLVSLPEDVSNEC